MMFANPGALRPAVLSAQDWEAHLEALPLATWIGAPDGKEVFVNQACRRLLGVTHLNQVTDRGWVRHLHPDDRADYVKAWDRFLNGQTARFRKIVRWTRPDTGQTVQLAVRAQKLSCGQFQGWIRPAHVEQALAKLEELAHVRR